MIINNKQNNYNKLSRMIKKKNFFSRNKTNIQIIMDLSMMILILPMMMMNVQALLLLNQISKFIIKINIISLFNKKN